MNRHQVLTGACNNGDQCYAVGSVEGIHFTAYATGCDIVILASDFQRVQIIPGVTHGNIKVSCIDCCTDTGKIAASYLSQVYIFEPTPLLHHESSHKLDYHWYQTAKFEAECVVNCLCWNLEGSRLLTAGEIMQAWQLVEAMDEEQEDRLSQNVKFQLGVHDDESPDHIANSLPHINVHDPDCILLASWHAVWRCKPSSAVYHLKYSFDGLLFASAGKNDRLVKIWYEDRKIQLPLSHADSSISPRREDLNYSFVYIAHPRAVTGFSWRKTSKYMPRGSVANMLVTSCKDNVCRIWCETILPDDGCIDLEQFHPNSPFHPKFHTQRHKKRFMQRLRTIRLHMHQFERHAIHKRKKQLKFGPETVMSMANIPSVHDFHKFAFQQNGVAPALHFHLAASVNPETDIPLQPVVGAKEDENQFQLHWLNNKELQFTMESEKILQEIHKDSLHHVDSQQKDQPNGDIDHQPNYNHIETESDHYHPEEDLDEGSQKKKKKSRFFRKKGKHKKQKDGHILGSHEDSQSSIGSDASSDYPMSFSDGMTPTSSPEGSLVDALDRKIEILLREWHQNPDMLFSIHPVDGSFMVWHIDWLDEYTPYSYRQAQISFSSRLPHAIPIPDARTMASNLLMYCNYSKMDIKSVMKLAERKSSTDAKVAPSSAATGKCSAGQNDNMLIPNVLMVSKHANGSLNQWQISFTENSKFTTVVSVAHASRACGHRFRTNTATCHPVLPLLLTTSHHNIPEEDSSQKDGDKPKNGLRNSWLENKENEKWSPDKMGIQFCSELILWRVDPVGPLSKSGGIIELARINSPNISAFSNVAWVPTLLPSTSFGTFSNSPSALFVASDGMQLRLYQAVIDARTLLMETSAKKEHQMSFSSNTSSGYSAEQHQNPGDLFNIVSLQSSSRPGCIIELEALTDAEHDWQQSQLLHVFQEQLVIEKSSKGDKSAMEPVVDLRNLSSFEEHFYLVVLEKAIFGGSTLHMWKITVSSSADSSTTEFMQEKNYVMDYTLVEADDSSTTSSRACSPDIFAGRPAVTPTLSYSSTKVSTQFLPLPKGVEVISANVAAGHLSSASIYPACLAPYLLVTACSDGEVRFWQCKVTSPFSNPINIDLCSGPSSLSATKVIHEFGIENYGGIKRPSRVSHSSLVIPEASFTWKEWKMMYQEDESSAIHVPGKPITVSCAYTGRVAIAYRSGGIKTVSNQPENKFFNLCVAIYECESTGGSEWVREDTIELKNIKMPDPKAEIDLDVIYGSSESVLKNQEYPTSESPKSLTPSHSHVNIVNMSRTKSVPSISTIYSVRRSISEPHAHLEGVLQQKHLVQLDWVSTEDGSHVLTVGVGPKIMMYGQVSNEIVQASEKAGAKGSTKMTDPGRKVSLNESNRRRSILQTTKSMLIDDYQEQLQWMKLRSIELTTADGLPPLPMHISWVRGGILVVAMDNEMHVYSQWQSGSNRDPTVTEGKEIDIRDFGSMSLNLGKPGFLPPIKSTPSFKPSYSVPNFKRVATSILKRDAQKSVKNMTNETLERSESNLSLTIIHELGLFEASRQANPVLPQYHPKSLMELLNFGKVRRVKAILAHLVRCIAGGDVTHATYTEDKDWEDSKHHMRQRAMSISALSSGEPVQIEEEETLDYIEISSIPPLPLYALLAADDDQTPIKSDALECGAPNVDEDQTDYNELFQTSFEDEVLDTNVLSTSAENVPSKSKLTSAGNVLPTSNPNYFGSGQAHLLSKHLTHVQLPGLSSLDQMYLLALADTVAHIKMDFADRFGESSNPQSGERQISYQPTESLDDCGLRFLLAIRHHNYLMRILPPTQRVLLKKQGLKTFNIVWAFHSEATEELVTAIPSVQKGEPTWEELREYGAGWFITNINVLKKTIEKVAKSAFQAKKDPMDSCVFYMALKKKNILWGLFRSVEDKKMADFFRNDFNEARWRKAALKNAFALLGRQRFMHAAGFFLLGGSLEDAVEVCIDKLADIQLALVICRLYDGEDIMASSVQRILNMNILGRNPEGGDTDPNKAHPDPFLRSMALWLLKDHKGALQTLLHDKKSIGENSEAQIEFDSFVTTSVFNFYNYLRTHPLLVRHRLAKAAPSMRRKSVIPGFTQQQSIMAEIEDEAFSCVDKITPMERRLFFSTAHAHCKNGCPILALEVLSKLPYVEVKEMPDFEVKMLEPMHEENEGCISTGILGDFSDSSQRADYVDWSQPVTSTRPETASSFDWSSPESNMCSRAIDIDWGTPVKKFDDEELKLDFRIGTSDAESEDEGDLDARESCSIPFAREGVPSIIIRNASEDTLIQSDVPDEFKELKHKIEQLKLEQEMKKKVTQQDIFAQQYKFIACLKILMEEMQTLATGFEVDGGQLRFQLYIWLEKEVEAMRSLCGYGDEDEQDDIKTVVSDAPTESNIEIDEYLTYVDSPRSLRRSMSNRSDSSLSKPSLHEVILSDKMDFEAKLERTARRKLWLKQHQQLLRTLIAYCMLQGAGGGGLASVQMELLLLLQELQQERPQQQLLSPLPFPTTLPLLSACIASSKTVTADPIRHIQCLTQDLLHTIIEFTSPPGLYSALNVMLVMRNLSIALSSCVYQCLCDSDSFVVSLNENQDVGLEGFTSHNFAIHASHLMAGVRRHRRRSISGSDDVINTSPAKWPGVTSLRVLLARGKDEDAPKLNIMLCETLIAVYVSLLINALSAYDCHLLYRLIAHKFDSRLWSALFGGGVKTVLRVSQSGVLPSNRSSDELLHKQRMKLHMKVMGTEGKHDIKKTYREKYIPPELSMITFFMTKPFIVTSDLEAFTYDSDESLSEEDENEEEDEEEEKDEKESKTTDRPKTLSLPSSLQQHNDPNSYSWCLLRYGIVKLVLHNLRGFLPEVGIELAELPICSPLMHATLRVIEQWEEVLHGKLELFAGPPDNFIPGIEQDIVPGIPSTKYKALLVPSNNPFINSHATLPIKRLWFHLVKDEELKDCFLRYIFKKRKMEQDGLQTEDSSIDGTEMQRLKLPMKIIHKEQDIITSFALNQATTSMLSLATQKEIVELDITNILKPPSWLDDENEMDIEIIKSPTPAYAGENVDFLVLQTPSDGNTMDPKGSDSPRSGHSSAATVPSIYPPWVQMMAQSGVGSNVLLRRPVAGVRRIGAHPHLPHYLTGSTDGSVRLWEWGHNQPLTILRQPGSFSKVTKVLFNSQGNKCCVSDTEGQICLWQVGMGSNFNKPILSLSCHNKTTSDFVFVGSSSLIGTAGHSSESRNVCLWDTLLPARSALVHAFVCHEHGSPAVAYASHHQLLISGGRNGEICLFDIRQRQLRHTFQAHESPIRCLAIDMEEEYFVTGSAEGDIKIWGLDVHQLILSLPGEHSKSGSFFRSVGTTSGVSQVAVGPGHHLFSCGIDGSMKFRVLPERDSVVRYWQP